MITLSLSRKLLLFLVIACTTINIHPPTHAISAGPWYVTPTGSDGNDCQSTGSPCATISGALGKASPGDTIYVATGTYTNIEFRRAKIGVAAMLIRAYPC